MKYAIVEVNGKQLWLEPKKQYKIDFLNFNLKDKKKIFLHRVLILKDEENFQIGDPYIQNAYVQAKILEPFKNSKILVYKIKSKKKMRRKYGYRQKFNKIEIEDFITTKV